MYRDVIGQGGRKDVAIVDGPSRCGEVDVLSRRNSRSKLEIKNPKLRNFDNAEKSASQLRRKGLSPRRGHGCHLLDLMQGMWYTAPVE